MSTIATIAEMAEISFEPIPRLDHNAPTVEQWKRCLTDIRIASRILTRTKEQMVTAFADAPDAMLEAEASLEDSARYLTAWAEGLRAASTRITVAAAATMAR